MEQITNEQITNERILTFRDEYKIAESIDAIENNILPVMQKIAAAYLALDMGNFTKTAFRDIQSGCLDLTENYIEKQEKALKAVGIRGKALEKLLDDSLEDLDPVKEAYKELTELDRRDVTLLGYVSIYESKPVFSNEDKDRLIEKYSKFVETEEEKNLYQQHQAAAESLNALLDHFTKKGYVINPQIFFNSLFEINASNKIEILPIDYK